MLPWRKDSPLTLNVPLEGFCCDGIAFARVKAIRGQLGTDLRRPDTFDREEERSGSQTPFRQIESGYQADETRPGQGRPQEGDPVEGEPQMIRDVTTPDDGERRPITFDNVVP